MKPANPTYTVYGLADPATDMIRYIGITRLSLEKRLKKHCYSSEAITNPHKHRWIASLGCKPTIMALKENLSEAQACTKEIELIATYRSKKPGQLTNIHEGGNLPPKGNSEERKKLLSKNWKGNKNPNFGKVLGSHPTSKKIRCTNVATNKIMTFDSRLQAASFLERDPTTITHAVKRNLTCNGWKCSYEN